MSPAADPYYNVPLEKMKNVLSEKKNRVKQLCDWNPDFIVGFLVLFCLFCYFYYLSDV